MKAPTIRPVPGVVVAVLVLLAACSSGNGIKSQSARRSATSRPATSRPATSRAPTSRAPTSSGTSGPGTAAPTDNGTTSHPTTTATSAAATTTSPASSSPPAVGPGVSVPGVHLDLNQTGCSAASSSSGGGGTTVPGVQIVGPGGQIQIVPNGAVIEGPDGERIDSQGCFAGPQCAVSLGSGSVVISAGSGRVPCGFGVTAFPQVKVPEITDPSIAVQQGPNAAIITVAADVLFDFDHSDIRPDAAGKLRQVAALLAARWPGRPVELRGHTDAVGDPGYNDDLSRRRAEATKAWLVANAGLNPEAVATVGLGSKVPVAPNTVPGGGDNPTGRQLNRRVEIVVATG